MFWWYEMIKDLRNLSVYQVTILLFFKPPDIILTMPPSYPLEFYF